MSDDEVSAAGVLGSHKLRQLRDAGYLPVDRERLECAARFGWTLARYKADREEEYEPRLGGEMWPATAQRLEFFTELCEDLGLEVPS